LDRVVHIAGVPVAVTTTTSRHGDAMADVLRGLPSHPGPPLCEIVCGPRPPAPLTTPPDESYGDLHAWRRGETLLLRHGDAVAATVTPTGAQLGLNDGEGLRRALHQVFGLAVAHLLGWQGRFVVHGGGLVGEGGGMLILGQTGSGKSTLVLAGIRSGRLAVSDDLVVLRHGGGGVEMAGLGLPIAVPEDVGHAFLDGAIPIPADPRARWSLPLDADAHGWHPLVACVVAGHSGSERGELATLGARAVFDMLLGSFLAVTEARLVRPYLSVASAASRVPAWVLNHSTLATSRVDVATRLLDTITASLRTVT